MSDTPTRAPLTDEQIDVVADAFNAHPMLLGYGEADRLLIAGALAIAAVRALDLAAVIARAKREEREERFRQVAMQMPERGPQILMTPYREGVIEGVNRALQTLEATDDETN